MGRLGYEFRESGLLSALPCPAVVYHMHVMSPRVDERTYRARTACLAGDCVPGGGTTSRTGKNGLALQR